MEKERLLITGGTGLLGLSWACAVRDRCDIVLAAPQQECALKGACVVRVQFGDGEERAQLVSDVRPTSVVHAAGLAGSTLRLDEELPRWRTLVSSVEPVKT